MSIRKISVVYVALVGILAFSRVSVAQEQIFMPEIDSIVRV